MNFEQQVRLDERRTALSIIGALITDVEMGKHSGLSSLYWLQDVFKRVTQELSPPGTIVNMKEYKALKTRNI